MVPGITKLDLNNNYIKAIYITYSTVPSQCARWLVALDFSCFFHWPLHVMEVSN